MKEKKKILLGLTTTRGSDWRRKVEEIDLLGIKEIALFPTVLKEEERRELYQLLEKTGLTGVPHVHLRHDMEKWELDFLVKELGTVIFNMHPGQAAEDFIERNKEYKDIIYTENLDRIGNTFLRSVASGAGICLDFTHWEDGVLVGWLGYNNFRKILEDHKIGCGHISAVKKESFVETVYFTEDKRSVEMEHFGFHKYSKLSDFDYMNKYLGYLPDIISLELENTFEEQLLAKEYLEKMIN